MIFLLRVRRFAGQRTTKWHGRQLRIAYLSRGSARADPPKVGIFAMGYFARERIFTGLGPNLVSCVPVFSANDLSEDECLTLENAVAAYLISLQEEGWHFDLQPGPEDDAVGFINLKREWIETNAKLDEYRRADKGSWRDDIVLLHDVASERADVIRDLRSGRTHPVFLQTDDGHGFETFDRVDCLTDDELKVLEAVLGGRLYDGGIILRVIDDWDAEKNPAIYVNASMQWQLIESDEYDDWSEDRQLSAEVVQQILALRAKPLLYSDVDSESDEEIDEIPFADEGEQEQSGSLLTPSESLRSGYQDPDNYHRNVWLYEQRKAGLNNAAILAELAKRAAEFAPLETENALRSAITSIALYHSWPSQKGKAGRPRKISRKASDGNGQPA
jgi:hypothetical protein